MSDLTLILVTAHLSQLSVQSPSPHQHVSASRAQANLPVLSSSDYLCLFEANLLQKKKIIAHQDGLQYRLKTVTHKSLCEQTTSSSFINCTISRIKKRLW